MPPKKQQTKKDKQKKEKATEDKTFGMKNKNKSAKVQRYIQQVNTQAKHNAEQRAGGPVSALHVSQCDCMYLRFIQSKAEALAEKKAAEQKKREEFAALFNPVQAPQKVPFGTDPKTVLCIYFKQGNCERGAKCKFSHDLNVGRKVEKKDLYTDHRAEGKLFFGGIWFVAGVN